MSKVKVLYVRNLKAETTEEALKEKFEEFGKVERVKKIKDYGFVHFEERDSAVKAMDELNGVKMGESELEISLAKPPSENRQKEKRKRADQMRFMMGRYGYDDYWGPPGPRGPPPGRGRFMRPPMAGGRGGYNREYEYDYYGNYGGYDPYYDEYYGYEDYSDYGYGSRGRRGGPPASPHRGRGGGPPRGGRGAGGIMARGRGGAMTPRGGKRKMGSDTNPSMAKKRNTDGNR